MRIPRLALLASFLLGLGAPAHGQDTAAVVPAQAFDPADPPGAFEVATRARLLADSALQAERATARLGAVGALRSDLADAVARHGELQALLASMVETDWVRADRLSRLRDQALLEDQRLEALRTRVLERLTQLAELRGRWVQNQTFWRRWRETLRPTPDFAAVAQDMDAAIERAATVLARASDAAGELLSLQQEIEELRTEVGQVAATVLAKRTEARRTLLVRGQPALLSARHRAQLGEGEWRAWDLTGLLRPRTYLTFLRGHLGLLGFHLLLALALGFLARHVRRTIGRRGEWAGLLEHPWALGTFLSVGIALQRILLAPPLWDVFLWSLVGATAAVLSRRLFATRALRYTVYLFAAFYPAFLLLEVAQLPTAVFRLGLATVAACALPVFLLHARRRSARAAAEGSADPRRLWPLRIGAAMWAVVLVAVVTGYDALGRWILHAAVTSGAVAFVVVIILTLARGALTVLLRAAEASRGTFLRRAGVRLGQRLVILLEVFLLIGAGLVLLDVWEIAESPVATWQRITAAGITLGELHVTVGRLLLGAVVIYLAVLLSGLVRALVESDLYRRWEVDRGVGESINRLVHYGLITLGFIFALGVIGLELQNFAIVAGALGIGVGFGLQNVVNNFASGLILLFERPVRVGDTVVVNEVWGTIQKIGLRSTVMLTLDQSEMIVPNADLVSEKVINWTLSNPIARVILPVGVAYGSDIPTVLSILKEAGTAHGSVLADPPPQGLFMGFGDSSLDFELRVWVNNIRLRLEVASVVLIEVERRLREAGIEIPFPQRDLHLRSVDADAAERLVKR